jgi:alpha-D-ribose 1-methylphosphonate 5-triphosphate synthase subunit PhnH
MRLDPVLDLQIAFRKILEAMASPGSIVDLGREAGLLDLDIPFNKGILLVALALVDGETSFCVASAEPEAQGRTISQLTYAKAAGLGESDFVFAVGEGYAAEAIASAKAGTLVDPHLGATLVVEVSSLDEGGSLLLSGPGIQSTARLGIGLEPGWIAARSSKNIEYPLGVDLLFVDGLSRLAALPRTTIVREGA